MCAPARNGLTSTGPARLGTITESRRFSIKTPFGNRSRISRRDVSVDSSKCDGGIAVRRSRSPGPTQKDACPASTIFWPICTTALGTENSLILGL